MDSVVTLSKMQLELLKYQIRKEVLAELKAEKEHHSLNRINYSVIMNMTKSYAMENMSKPYDFTSAISNIVRRSFKVDRLDQISTNKLDSAIELTKELLSLVDKYHKMN
nr:hypothetical protein [Brevibacillus laterosporus]